MLIVIEPGLLRIFRYFTGLAMMYFAVMVAYATVETGQWITPSQIQSYINFGINMLLFGYLSWPWLRQRLRRWYLPIALIAATVVPILSNLLYLAEPQGPLSLTIVRSWVLFPILVVPLGLIAWQYQFQYVLAFIVFSVIVELSVLLPVVTKINFETLPILGVPLIRAFAFGTVGQIVSHLIDTQRAQRKKILHANVQLSQHAQTLEQLATSRERNRLARELHDTLAHTLSAQAVNLEAIKLMISPEQGEIRAMLERSLASTRTGLAETRRAMKDLRSKQLEDLGLSIGIRNLARSAAFRADFDLEFHIPEQLPELSIDVEQCVYRIAQEALENIVRHSDAHDVTVGLSVEDSTLQLRIADDGRGFDPTDLDWTDKLGIQGMKERVEMLRGSLEVISSPGRGTEIQLLVEVHDDQSIHL
ncbi:MAG: sensor histidine kinase [Anaerolineaceae bacterium]|nr:sensor histidine kinase [Anaerolineaceae bacterium]